MSISANERMCAAEARALHDLRQARLGAERLSIEIDQITDAGWRPEIHDEDSVVTQLEIATASSKRVATGGR